MSGPVDRFATPSECQDIFFALQLHVLDDSFTRCAFLCRCRGESAFGSSRFSCSCVCCIIKIVSFGLNTVGQEDEKELKATHALSESHNLIQEAEIISAKLMPWGEP